MRRLFLRSGLVIAGLAALFIAWIIGARTLALGLDRIHTVVMETQPVTKFGLAEGSRETLRINDLSMSVAAPDDSPWPLALKVDPARQFVVQMPGHAIVLGPVDNSLGVRPLPADRARFQIERSMLSWPTPLAINFMTGHSPSWKRHLYYRLIWEKPDGSRLEMVWRYEQYYYDAWASGFMTRAGVTGLIRVDIRP